MKNNEVVNQYHKSSVAHAVMLWYRKECAQPNRKKKKKKKKTIEDKESMRIIIVCCIFFPLLFCCHYYYFSRNVRNRLTDLSFSFPSDRNPFSGPLNIGGPINWIRWNRRLKASINYPESIRIKFKLQFGFTSKTVVPILDSLSVIYAYCCFFLRFSHWTTVKTERYPTKSHTIRLFIVNRLLLKLQLLESNR